MAKEANQNPEAENELEGNAAVNESAKACLKAALAHPKLKGKSQATIIKAGIFKFIADELGVKPDAPERGEAFKAFMATKAAFGASANALTDGFKLVEKGSRSTAEIGDFTL